MRRLRRELVVLAVEMRARGLVTGTVGNISARHGRGMLITPTRMEYTLMRPRDLIALSLEGEPLGSGRGTPSREWPMHASVYRARPDVQAIIHTHSPHATARSFDDRPLEVETEERDYLSLERIDVAAWAPAGSGALGASATASLGDRSAVLLARHGVLAVGPTPREALELACAVEHQAIIARERSLAAQSLWS